MSMKKPILLLPFIFLFGLFFNEEIKSQTLIFEEDFEIWQGWSPFNSGNVEHSDEQSRSHGYSLKKITNNDPNGGWKALGHTIGRDFTFEGWIYRPSDAGGGAQDRISIADSNFNGYGIRVTGTNINIEKRVGGAHDGNIATNVAYTRPDNEWYRFVFVSNDDNTFTFSVYDEGGTQQATVTSDADTDYNTFDRIVIHGGHHFYVDDISVAVENLPPPVTDGLILHLDANTINGLSDDDNVEEWLDRSGEENHASQTNAPEQPVYKTNILNGLPVVRFDGNDILEIPSSESLNFTDPGLTIMTVFQPLSLQDEERPMIRKDNQFQLGLFPDDGIIRNLINTDDVSGWVIDNDEDFDWEEQNAHIYGFTWDGNDLRHFVDADQIGDDAEVAGDIIPNANPLLIGGEDPDGRRINADIGEILIFNRSLTPAERNEVENYLFVKWFGEKRTWYSYINGDWENPDTWTTDPSGTTYTGPEDMIPGPIDNVVIIDGNEVTVNTDNITVYSMEVRNGTLDLGLTEGHFFNFITGSGKIKLMGDNFPEGQSEHFRSSNGGTVEFYGNSFELEEEQVFNNMIVNMDNSNQVLTLLADYTLNGNLDVENGIFRINDDVETDILNLTINRDLSVSNGAQITVGEGDTRSGYQIGGSLPALGDYHSIFHQIMLYGNFNNNGSVRFTNQEGPNFRELTQNGAVVFNFTGTRDQNVQLSGTTDFYNLIVDKGSGQTHTVEINSDNEDYFALYGPNNLANNTGGDYTEENPEVRKALWIKNGILKLSGEMHIPSLTEGNEHGDRGDFVIPSNGKLWIDGASVTVYTTIRFNSQRPENTNWHNTSQGHTGITLFGTFRIDAGFFGTRHSAGFIYRPEDEATIKVNGGIVDAATFRSTWESNVGKTFYYQSGGEVRVRGTRDYDGESGGQVNHNYPLFGITETEGVFNMSGGEILMIGVGNDLDNDFGNNGLYIIANDYNVTGGTIRLLLQGGDEFFIESTANLWNLEMERIGGGGNIDVRFTRELTISNDLLIGDNVIFHPRRSDGSTNYDLLVGRNFYFGQTAGSNAHYNSIYDDDGNTTTFFGNQDAIIDIANNVDNFLLEFYDLTVDKSVHERKVSIVSDGRPHVDLNDGGPFDVSPVLIENDLIVNRGVLDYGDFAIIIDQEDATVINRSTIGIIGEQNGFLILNDLDQIIAPAGTQPEFGNLVIDDPNGVSLTGVADISIGNLALRRGIFDIGNQGITIEEEVLNIDDIPGAEEFSNNKLILTAGNHSDRGVTLKIPSEGNGTYHFPIGTWNFDGEHIRYAYAEPTLSGVPEGGGYLQINGVPSRLPTLGTASPERYLQYYWRVRHSGFSSTPDVLNLFRSYEDDFEGVNNWNNHNQVVGKIVNNIRSPEHPNQIGELIDNSPIHYLSYDINELEIGEFTAARTTMFNGDIRVYYTRDHGSSTGVAAREPNWRDHNTWTRSDHNDFDPDNPHSSSNPHAGNGNYPRIGDIAVIGWVPWDDPKEDLRGLPHGVWINNTQEEVAQIQFTQMTDEDGNPVPRRYRSNFQFRPTLCINDNGGELEAGWVEGEGMFWIRIGDPDLTSMDMGDFVTNDSTYIVYENFDANRTYLNTPDIVSNIIFANNGWGSNNHNVTIAKDITALGNFKILGNLNLVLNNEETGDINVGNDFIMFEITDPIEGSPSGGGAELVFPNDGYQRNITINQNLNLDNRGALIRVGSPNSANTMEHNINLYGNIIQNTGGGGSPNGLRFFTEPNHDRILLNILGEESKSWIYYSGETADLYNITINKGNSVNTSFTINSNFNIGGPVGGDADEKSIQLINGMLILNHEDIDIIITSGGDPYVIKSTAGLTISQGRVNAEGSNVDLEGFLRIDNSGEMSINNSLAYSSTGYATFEIADSGILEVGEQIRGRTSGPDNIGVLKYRQSGGAVSVGTGLPNLDSRGVFEIFNPGSEFNMTGGELTIASSQGVNPQRAPLYLRPTSSNVSNDAVINIGNASTNNDIIEIDVASGIILPSLNIMGTDVIAKLRHNNIILNGNLFIDSSNAFDGDEDYNLTINGNIINNGNSSFNTDSLIMNGVNQTIEGDLELNNFVINTSSQLTLENDTDIEVAEYFYLNQGTFNDGGNTVTVLKDVHNYATFNSDNPLEGGLEMAGSSNQRIYGNGTFGRLEIDNPGSRVILQGPMELENNLVLTNGILDLRGFRLTLGLDSEIENNGDFGTNRMIITDGVYESRGLAKRIGTGSGDFFFPIGVEGKFTPVELDYSQNNSSGLVAVTPVNSPHMTITVDPEHDLDILDYYWYVETEGLSDFNGDLFFHYHPNDVNGDASEYIAARLYNAEWHKYPEDFVVDDEDYFYFENRSNLDGEYTAGTDEDIPDEVPLYISTNSGDWEVGTNWRHSEDDTPAPEGGPSGVRALILEEHDIIVEENRRIVYELGLEGSLDLDDTYGHNFREVYGGGTLMIKSNVLPAGRFDDFYGTPGSTMVYYGDLNYTISERYTEFQNLIVRDSGRKELPSTASPWNIINGDLSIENDASFEVDGRLELRGNLTIDNSDASYDVSNWTYFTGNSQNQTITGDFVDDAAIERFHVNKDDFHVIIDGDVEIDDMIYLEDGIITVLNNSKFHLKNNSPFNVSSDFDSSRIEGALTRRLSSGSYNADDWNNLFPVGKIGRQRFVRLNNVSVHNQDWTVEYFAQPPIAGGMDQESFEDPIEMVSHSEYWSVEGPGGENVNVQLNWGEESNVGDYIDDLVVAKWDDTQWISKGGIAEFTDEPTEGRVISTEVSFFSENFFTLASSDEESPLPVCLLTFQAEVVNGKVNLQWITATEINNDFFTIQRSKDGENFEKVNEVPSKAEYGYSNSVLFYEEWDENPYQGISYYRLKQTDFDGKYEYSDIIVVNVDTTLKRELSVDLYPNPNRGRMFYLRLRGFEAHEELSFVITDVIGNVLHSETIQVRSSGSGVFEIFPQQTLERGVYVLSCTSCKHGKINIRMIVQ